MILPEIAIFNLLLNKMFYTFNDLEDPWDMLMPVITNIFRSRSLTSLSVFYLLIQENVTCHVTKKL